MLRSTRPPRHSRESISVTEYIPVSTRYALNKRVRIESECVRRRVLDDAYTWLEDGVMDPSEGTRPWITEDIPAGRIR